MLDGSRELTGRWLEELLPFEPTGDQLTAFEAFKVYDGQIHAVEAFIRILPLELAKGGWD